MSKKVAVIMSTFNGEKFIREQLDSILNQTYNNIEIVIRDDGSTDSTVKIIKEYQKEYPNVTLYEGENKGFIKSFFELLKLADGDYYSYADQDDIWIENKIELAVNSLNGLNEDVPNMAFGNSDYYDENMKFIGHSEKNKQFSFTKALFACVSQGMTMTVNRRTRDMIIECMPKSCFFHDWWTYLLCIGMGNVVYNNETTVKYRRRKENATSEGQGYLRLITWRIKNLLFDNGLRDIKQQMKNYKEYYYFELSPGDRDILDIFADDNYNYSFSSVFKKMFYPHRLRNKISDEIMLRIVFLLGVL